MHVVLQALDYISVEVDPGIVGYISVEVDPGIAIWSKVQKEDKIEKNDILFEKK
ncbi:hypothetical protein RhiirA4_489100 [Rhizophagus irregularis]|uniref:Uncharacterized protein n=1 Tax=Rhizophagus irregularis TaxID=588596 RepID=A0A2I1HUF6_9GLOM|nr:hypothetical protein RhiirA4_489100 [Rhizophagus irregularis]